jgi:hypothetical protein
VKEIQELHGVAEEFVNTTLGDRLYEMSDGLEDSTAVLLVTGFIARDPEHGVGLLEAAVKDPTFSRWIVRTIHWANEAWTNEAVLYLGSLLRLLLERRVSERFFLSFGAFLCDAATEDLDFLSHRRHDDNDLTQYATYLMEKMRLVVLSAPGQEYAKLVKHVFAFGMEEAEKPKPAVDKNLN